MRCAEPAVGDAGDEAFDETLGETLDETLAVVAPGATAVGVAVAEVEDRPAAAEDVDVADTVPGVAGVAGAVDVDAADAVPDADGETGADGEAGAAGAAWVAGVAGAVDVDAADAVLGADGEAGADGAVDVDDDARVLDAWIGPSIVAAIGVAARSPSKPNPRSGDRPIRDPASGAVDVGRWPPAEAGVVCAPDGAAEPESREAAGAAGSFPGNRCTEPGAANPSGAVPEALARFKASRAISRDEGSEWGSE